METFVRKFSSMIIASKTTKERYCWMFLILLEKTLIHFHNIFPLLKNPIGFSSSWDFNENTSPSTKFSLLFSSKTSQGQGLTGAAVRRNLSKYMLSKFFNIHRKTSVWESLFNKVVGWCFLWTLPLKFLRTCFFIYNFRCLLLNLSFNSTYSRLMTQPYRSKSVVYNIKIWIKYWSIKRFLFWYL